MENKNIIIVLLVVAILILACFLGSMLMPASNAQKDSRIAITTNKTLYSGDNLTVKLTDLNKTPIKKAVINVTVSDKKGKVVIEKSLKTNSKGKANLNLDLDAGKYTVNVTFSGDENFTGNTTSKKITIAEEEVVEPEVTYGSDQESSSDESNDNGIVNSREFESFDYYPGHNVKENTYADGDVERYYDDGSYEYNDYENHMLYYKNKDGSSGSMYIG